MRDSSLRLFEQAEVLTARMPTLATYFYHFPKAPLPPGAQETYYTLVGAVVRKEVREGIARYVAAVKRAMEGA